MIKTGKTYKLRVKNNAYWSSMDGTRVKVLEYPYIGNGYTKERDVALVRPVGGGLEFWTNASDLE